MSQVVDVVAGAQFGNCLDRFLSTLGMHAVIFPLRRRKRFQQVKVGLAKSGEAFERSARIRFAITHGLRPLVLIEALNVRARSAKDRANPLAEHNFRVRQMGQDFRNRPFAGRRLLTQF